MDLAVLYRQRRWVYLLELIDGLPQASRLTSAIANDPETVEQILDADAERPHGDWHPPLAEYDMHAQLLTYIGDAITALQSTVLSIGGGKPERPKPLPRPRTQIDVMRERRSAEQQQRIMSLFAPHSV